MGKWETKRSFLFAIFDLFFASRFNVFESDIFLFMLHLIQALRRLAQNREAARKSRMRKKVTAIRLLLEFEKELCSYLLPCLFNGFKNVSNWYN